MVHALQSKQQFVQGVVQLFPDIQEKQRISDWVIARLCNTKSKEELNTEASEFLRLPVFVHQPSTGRYRFIKALDSQDVLIERIFQKVYADQKTAFMVLGAKEKQMSSVYSKWEKIVYVDTPHAIKNVFGSIITKCALCAIVGVGVAFASLHFLSFLGTFMLEKGMPFLINHLPSYVFRYAGILYQTVKTLEKEKYSIFIMIAAIGPFLSTKQKRVLWDLWDVLFYQPFFLIPGFVFHQVMNAIIAVFDSCSVVEDYFKNIALDQEVKFNKLEKDKALKIWLDLFPKQAA